MIVEGWGGSCAEATPPAPTSVAVRPRCPKSLTHYANDLYAPCVHIEWDEAKNLANQRNHRISFEEARVLFESGVDYLEIFDATHSVEEDRFVAIGQIRRGLVLVVWTERQEDVVRIISARMATRHETKLYTERMRDLS